MCSPVFRFVNIIAIQSGANTRFAPTMQEGEHKVRPYVSFNVTVSM